jgi:ribosomal protein L11 methyltransferase
VTSARQDHRVPPRGAPPEAPRYPTVHAAVPAGDVDDASAALWALGATGVEERDATTLEKPGEGGALLVAHFDDEDRARVAAAALAEENEGWKASVEHIVGDEWKHRWKEFWKPMRVGTRLVVRPSWEEVERREGDVVLTLDPGQAFGTGTHESTRLVLAEVEKLVRGGETVLDAGCGSGILGIGALLLGAESVRAVDVDEDAIAATRENAEKNRVVIDASTTPVARVRGTFDLVLANIERRVLVPMARDLAARVAPGGALVLSGLLVGEEDEVLRAYAPLAPEARAVERDWVALVLRKGAKARAEPEAKPKASASKAKPEASASKAKPKASASKAKPKASKANPKASKARRPKASKTEARRPKASKTEARR